MSAFVDTSAAYALLVRTEDRHRDVVRAFRGLVEARRALWTTSYVIVETMALLQHRIGLEAVRDFLDHFVPLFSVEWVSEALHAGGVARLLREDRRRLSLVDCVSLECIHARGIGDVLALDPHFEEAGCRVLPMSRTS